MKRYAGWVMVIGFGLVNGEVLGSLRTGAAMISGVCVQSEWRRLFSSGINLKGTIRTLIRDSDLVWRAAKRSGGNINDYQVDPGVVSSLYKLVLENNPPKQSVVLQNPRNNFSRYQIPVPSLEEWKAISWWCGNDPGSDTGDGYLVFEVYGPHPVVRVSKIERELTQDDKCMHTGANTF